MSSRKGRMIWVRIFSVGIVRRLRTRGLANTVPTLGGYRVGGAEEDELIGAAVCGRKGVARDGMDTPVAGGALDRRLGDHGLPALAVDATPLVGNCPAGAVGREASARHDRHL